MGFKRITLEPGEQSVVEIPVEIGRLAYWSEQADRFVVQPGDYRFDVGASSADLRVRCGFMIN